VLFSDYQLLPSVLGRESISEGGSFVVHSENDFPRSTRWGRFAQPNNSLGAAIRDFLPFAGKLNVGMPMRVRIDSFGRTWPAELCPVSEKHSESGIPDDLCVAEQHSVMGRAFGIANWPKTQFEFHSFVWRRYGHQ
jgi:hypothetical protein